jgi:hypothetical protein
VSCRTLSTHEAAAAAGAVRFGAGLYRPYPRAYPTGESPQLTRALLALFLPSLVSSFSYWGISPMDSISTRFFSTVFALEFVQLAESAN